MKKRTGNFFTAVLLVPAVCALLPLFITLGSSFMPESEVTMNYSTRLTTFDVAEGITAKFIRMFRTPRRFSVDQYAQVLVRQPSFLLLLFNSFKITIPVVLGNLAVSLASAYGFARSRGKHTEKYTEALFKIYIVVMLLPLQAVLVPNYIIARRLGIGENSLAIILPGIFSPFGVFLLRQSLKSFPPSYFEAAEIDGAGHWCILMHILAPQIKSSLAALCMLNFIDYWNLVDQAVIFITDYTKEPLSVYLSRLGEGHITLVFAASCVYLLPPLWFLFCGQEHLEKGIETLGLK
jgi:multiple sugar transport system permease protein